MAQGLWGPRGRRGVAVLAARCGGGVWLADTGCGKPCCLSLVCFSGFNLKTHFLFFFFSFIKNLTKKTIWLGLSEREPSVSGEGQSAKRWTLSTFLVVSARFSAIP